jgi:hypothetical protein
VPGQMNLKFWSLRPRELAPRSRLGWNVGAAKGASAMDLPARCEVRDAILHTAAPSRYRAPALIRPSGTFSRAKRRGRRGSADDLLQQSIP